METCFVEIEPMGRQHLDEVYAIEVSIYPMPWSRDLFENELSKNQYARYYVALAEGKVVGYIGLWMALGEGHITNIAVSYGYRRRKVAEQMLTHVIEECLRNGVGAIFLEVRRYNLAAQMLYTRYGFRPVRVRERYYQDNDEDGIELRVENMGSALFIGRFRMARERMREQLRGGAGS